MCSIEKKNQKSKWYSIGKILSIISNKIKQIKSSPLFRGLFSDKENEQLNNIFMN